MSNIKALRQRAVEHKKCFVGCWTGRGRNRDLNETEAAKYEEKPQGSRGDGEIHRARGEGPRI